jgi:hypothetical protein
MSVVISALEEGAKPRQRCHSLAQRVSAGMWDVEQVESALADGTSFVETTLATTVGKKKAEKVRIRILTRQHRDH